MTGREEDYQEIERLARLICTSLGQEPDALRMDEMPCPDGRYGGWYVTGNSTPHLTWMRYWRPAAAIYADAKMRAQMLSVGEKFGLCVK